MVHLAPVSRDQLRPTGGKRHVPLVGRTIVKVDHHITATRYVKFVRKRTNPTIGAHKVGLFVSKPPTSIPKNTRARERESHR